MEDPVIREIREVSEQVNWEGKKFDALPLLEEPVRLHCEHRCGAFWSVRVLPNTPTRVHCPKCNQGVLLSVLLGAEVMQEPVP